LFDDVYKRDREDTQNFLN
jgi:hypothetical protein